MSSLVPMHCIAYLAVLLVLFLAADCYDLVVCLTRIKLDSYWDDDFYGVDPYAIIWVGSEAKLTTESQSAQEVSYGDSDWCVGLDSGEYYGVQLWESNYGDHDTICIGQSLVMFEYDSGSHSESCTDAHGYTNYFDYFVYKQPFEVPLENIELIGSSNVGFSTQSSLSDCEAVCEGNSACNYLSYGQLTGYGTGGMCIQWSSYDSAVQNEYVTSVSYSCDAAASYLSNGLCHTIGTQNTADCGWDGGECCVTTNDQLTSNDDCEDPRHQETTTTTPTPRDSVIINSVEFLGSAVATVTYDSANLPDCMTRCDWAAAGTCNYISYDSTHTCKMFTSVTGVIVNAYAYGVSYMCSDTSYVGSDTCSSGLNTADCGWDGGDCCTDSNLYLSSDDDCVDPRYATTTTTTTTTTASDTADLTLCEFILDNTDGMEYSQIGDGYCDTSSIARRYSYTLNGVGGITTVNDATCDWDGGDCCTATNSALSTDDYCLNPLYTTTTTSTTSSSTESTSTTPRNQGSDANSNTLIAVVLVVTAAISFL